MLSPRWSFSEMGGAVVVALLVLTAIPLDNGSGAALQIGPPPAPEPPPVAPATSEASPGFMPLGKRGDGSANPTARLVIFLRDQPLSRLTLGDLPPPAEITELGTAATWTAMSDRASMVSDKRSRLIQESQALMETSRSTVVHELGRLGVEVLYSGRIVNSLVVMAPTASLGEISRIPYIDRVYFDHSLEGGLSTSVPSTGMELWWSKGFNGTPFDIAVVDTGVDFSHPYLVEGPSKVFHEAGRYDPYYADRADKTDDLHGHGTHVAGILASQDATYRGGAYGSRSLVNAKFAWRTITGGTKGYWSDAMAAIDWAIAEAGADVISFSFGSDVNGNGESGFSRYLDAVVDYLGVPVVVGVMNFGPSEHTAGTPSDAFNVISVGNMDDRGTLSRIDDVLHFASGRGPTADGRIKPDIVAPGTSIASTSHHWDSVSLLVNMSGTSMATPHVTAAVALLLSYFEEPVFPALLKAVLINSADDLGATGPDSGFGWGYLNMTRAMADRQNYVLHDLSPAIPYRFYELETEASESATLVWQRHVVEANLGERNASVNLNLEAYDSLTGDLLAVSDSLLDNVEQVRLDNTSNGAVLKVKAADPLSVGERFALAASTAIREVEPPSLLVETSHPCAVVLGDAFEVEAIVRNSGGLEARGIQVSLVDLEGVALLSGQPDIVRIDIPPGEERRAGWTLSAEEEGSWPLKISMAGTSWGEVVFSDAQSPVIIQGSSWPLILEHRVVPAVMGVGTQGSFEARICAGTGISEARLSVFGELEMTSDNMTMALDTDGRYRLSLTLWSLGSHRYRVMARDGAGNWDSAEGTFTVADLRPPDIGPVTFPELQEKGAPVILRARIIDNSSIPRVTASFWHSDGKAAGYTVLEPVGETEWETSLTFGSADEYTARIWAVDSKRNVAMKELQFRVVAGQPPVARIDAPSEVFVGEEVYVSAIAEDDFGISSISWKIVGPDAVIVLDELSVKHVFEEPGTYRLTLLVADHAGNRVYAEQQIRVKERPVALSLPASVFLPAVGVTGVLILLLFLRRRMR